MNNKDKQEELTEYEKAQLEYMKGKVQVLQGCAGCMIIPCILFILFCILLLVAILTSPSTN
ncbi:hypothetical protein C3V43_00470 [Bacteroides heparinolyticus]|nr:hypothetical protein C3V43_00470 [Bacteroides heparinolyticus]